MGAHFLRWPRGGFRLGDSQRGATVTGAETVAALAAAYIGGWVVGKSILIFQRFMEISGIR